MILSETINTFIGSFEKNITPVLQRCIHNDMFNLLSRIDAELNSLPKDKKDILKKEYINILKNEIRRFEQNEKNDSS